MTTRCLPATLFLGLIVALAPPGLVAQAPSSPVASDAATQLATIGEALERIADVLESQLQGRRLDLVLRRMDLAERRLAPLESRLRSIRSSREGYVAEQFRLRLQLGELADQLRSGTVEMDVDSVNVMTGHLESELKLIEMRLRATDAEIAELESDVSRSRIEIDDWESWIDRELGGL